MQSLGKDLRMEIALNLSPPDLVRLCATNKRENNELCSSDIFWRKKLEKDYPQEMHELKNSKIFVRYPKNLYMKRFATVSSKIEKFISVFINYNFGADFVEYLSKEYKQKLFDGFYSGYNAVKNYDFSQNSNPKEDIIHDIVMDEIAEFFPDPQYYVTYEQMEVFRGILLTFLKELFSETLFDIINMRV